MKTIHRRKLIVDAVLHGDGRRIDQLVAQLEEAERTREILQAKGYGRSWMAASTVAASVPEAKR